MTQVAWEDIASQSDQLQNVALITYDSKEHVTNIVDKSHWLLSINLVQYDKLLSKCASA